MKREFRALVLAAGRGERLRPLTGFEPKPLLPIGGRPLVEHTLAVLRRSGCVGVALNLHHLGERLRERLGESFGGMPLTWSPEAELLGTLGALAPLRDFWRSESELLVINGDSLCRWPVAGLLRRHRKSGAAATLLLSTRADTRAYGGGVGVAKDGRVVSLRPGDEHGEVHRRRVFAGAHVVATRLLGELSERPADFVDDLWAPLLERGEPVQTLSTRRSWREVGTPDLYLAAARKWARSRWPLGPLRRQWVSPDATLHATAKVRGSVVEGNVEVGEGARVSGSLLLPGARVGAGSRVVGSILGFGAALPPETTVERRVVTPKRADVPPRGNDSVVGTLVYGPLHP